MRGFARWGLRDRIRLAHRERVVTLIRLWANSRSQVFYYFTFFEHFEITNQIPRAKVEALLDRWRTSELYQRRTGSSSLRKPHSVYVSADVRYSRGTDRPPDS